MSNRRKRRVPRSRLKRFLDSEFSKPIGALMLLALIWLAIETGFVGAVASRILAPMAPRQTDAGDLYRPATGN